MTHKRQNTNVDPFKEFSRLRKVEERFFEYEFTPAPTSLFKDDVMRKPMKGKLANMLISDLPNIPVERVTNIKTEFILDGGALLYQVQWPSGKTYRDVFKDHSSYILYRYGVSRIIYDGYESGPSTKDHEHKRRYGSFPSKDTQINENDIPHESQKDFLANKYNKKQFIRQLGTYLESDRHSVSQNHADADTKIVSEATRIASREQHVTVVSNDTDILVLLLYHWKSNMADIHLRSVEMKEQGRPKKLTSIKEAAEHLGGSVLDHLLVVHAWSGCDTTSAICGNNKSDFLNLVKNSEDMQQWCKIIEQDDSTREKVGEAGAKIFVEMYGGAPDDTLTTLRFERYQKDPATRISGMGRLPPTEGAALQHSLRVHLQVMEWKHLNVGQSQMQACDWGWMNENNRLTPIMTKMPIAPRNLSQHVICDCSTSSQNACSSSSNCPCRIHGLRCALDACHQGQWCGNEYRKGHMKTRQSQSQSSQ